MRENAAKTPLSYRTWREVREQVYGPRTLTEFLLARIAEDEAEAKRDTTKDRSDAAWTFAYQTPDRLLAECEAKRRIVEDKGLTVFIDPTGTQVSKFGHRILTYLALPYADHPDYREEWKP